MKSALGSVGYSSPQSDLPCFRYEKILSQVYSTACHREKPRDLYPTLNRID
jgi:hypothetical protein